MTGRLGDRSGLDPSARALCSRCGVVSGGIMVSRRYGLNFALLALATIGPVASAAGGQASRNSYPPAVAELAERDPLLDPRGDVSRWRSALAALPAKAPVIARLRAIRGIIQAANLNQQPDVARAAYADAAPTLARSGAAGAGEAAIIHALGASVLLMKADDDTAKAALAAARAIVPKGDLAAQSFVTLSEGDFTWARDDIKATVAFQKRAWELASAAFGPTDPWTLAVQVRYAETVSYIDRPTANKVIEAAEAASAGLPVAHPTRVPLIFALAIHAEHRGRRVEARELVQRAIDLGATLWGPTDRRLFGPFQYAAIIGENATISEAFVRQAIAVSDANPGLVNAPDQAMNDELLSHYVIVSGRPVEAVALLRGAIGKLAEVDRGDIRWPHIQIRLARALSAVGEHREAVELVRVAAPGLAAKLPVGHNMRGVSESISAKVLADAGFPEEGYRRLEPVLAEQEKGLLDLVAREQSTGILSSSVSDVFRDAAYVALKSGREEAGLRFAELASLSDLAVATSFVRYPDRTRDAKLKAEIARLKAARDAEAVARRIATNADAPASAQDALSAARTARQQAEAEFERMFPDYLESLRPQPVPLDELKASLGPNEAVLLPLVMGERTVTLTVTRAGLTWDTDAHGWGRGTTRIRKLRESLDRSVADPEGRDLFDYDLAYGAYRSIFTPKIERALRGIRQLTMPTDGAFSYLPPAMLITAPRRPGRTPDFLIRKYAVSVRSSFDRQRAGPTASQGILRFAGIGDPTLGPAGPVGPALRSGKIDLQNLRDLPSLASAQQELSAMSRAFGANSLLLTGARATEPMVRGTDLSGYGVVAFATHGLVSGEISGLREPALVLTPPTSLSPTPNPADDGLLTAAEIAQLNLAADWVILSACNTSAGGSGGLRYSGLARAFRLAGARSLLLSHWAVRDDVAARLTVRTVQLSAKGVDRAEALRRAQVELIDDRRVPGADHPAVWAPFVLVTR